MYREKIVNIKTGEETIREYTPKEIAEVEATQAAIAAKVAEQEAKEAARQAVLNKLGLNADDIKALLG